MKKKLKLVSEILLVGLLAVSGAASATSTINFDAIDTGQVDEDFNPIYSGGFPAQVPGYANVSGACASCYHETVADGAFVIGTLSDSLASNHVHGDLDGANALGLDYSVGYHNDSSGFYIRKLDGSAFKAFSLFWDNDDLTANARGGTWEILGFNTAANTVAMTATSFGNIAAEGAALQNGDGTNYAGNRVAYQTVVQGPASNPTLNPRFAGTLNLDAAFSDADGVNAIWIHFKSPTSLGAPLYLTAAEANALTPGFKVNIDNIVVGSVTAVPVPAAVWMFGSGLLGMLSFVRRKSV